MAENPNTHDPEYNSEAIHSGEDDPWFDREESADETYHPHDELLIHEYAPQERERVTGNVPAYTPKVNTGGEYEPDPHNPEPEPNSLHIVSYGTVEDVMFSDDPDERRNGLVSMSIRDEMDDLIHTDFHTLNPLSLLSDVNTNIGKRVRVDIQDYKNVVEWFIYNYPMLLKVTDLLQVRASDGPWFYDDRRTTVNGDPNPMYGKNCMGGNITTEPSVHNPVSGYEDWEHPNIGSQLDKSYLEIGQRDGNKKITLRQFLQLLDDWFHISDLWETVRDHEKRLVHLERDMREEDVKRNKRIDKVIDSSMYVKFPHSDWDMSDPSRIFPSKFTGNVENGTFGLWTAYRDSLHCHGVTPWGDSKERGGKYAHQIFATGTIPEEFRPHEFRWVVNYGYVVERVGAWEDVLQGHNAIDFGFDPDGSVWVDVDSLDDIYAQPRWNSHLGIFGPNGPADHQLLKPAIPSSLDWHFSVDIYSFGGTISIGDGSDGGDAW